MLELLRTDIMPRKRNKQVAGHPCPAHLGGQDARREELALGATCGYREVRAESGVARGGGARDVQGQTQRVVRVHFSARSAPQRGETDAHHAPPMPWQAALPYACGALA